MKDKRERLERLIAMATLISDARSRTLRQENEVRCNLQKQLATLETRSTAKDLPWPVIEKGQFGYEQWVARRRSDLNLRLAAQTVVCLQAADHMRMALARKIVVERLTITRLRNQLS